jgi:hypothetical protein
MTSAARRRAAPQEEQMQRVVGSYGSYTEARRRLDHLAGRRFPMHRVRLVARGSRAGADRAGWARFGGAAVRGWLLGVVAGSVAGLLAGLLVLTEPWNAALTVAAAGAIAGAAAGMALGVGVELFGAGRGRPPPPTGQAADGYDLVADEPVADWARRLLAEADGDGDPGRA